LQDSTRQPEINLFWSKCWDIYSWSCSWIDTARLWNGTRYQCM